MSTITHYSDYLAGQEGNYSWKVKFDKTLPEKPGTAFDRVGFIGISQVHEDGSLERVLLSPEQAVELRRFLEKMHPFHL